LEAELVWKEKDYRALKPYIMFIYLEARFGGGKNYRVLKPNLIFSRFGRR